MKWKAAGRVGSVLFTAGGWLVAGARTVLDLIGYSTVPEDAAVAQTRIDQFINWLLGVPWWAPWGFALIATLFLIWVSWPSRNARAPYQEEESKFEYDPWAGPEVKTYIELQIDISEWKAKAIEISNIFDHNTKILGNDNENIEIVLVFDKYIVSRNVSISCTNRGDNYKTSHDKITDRYAVCNLFGVKFPCNVRIEF